MYFQKNVDLLKKYNYRITEELNQIYNEKNCQYIASRAKNGEVIIGKETEGEVYYFSSQYNPRNEVEQYFKNELNINNQSVIIMYGFSNGEFAKYIREKNQNVRIIIYEPDINILCKAMETIDLGELLNSEYIYIATGTNIKEQFEFITKAVIDRYNYKYLQIYSLYAYRKHYQESYPTFLEILKEALHYMQINLNTEISYGDYATFAAVQNMRFLSGCRSGVQYYQDVFPEDMPAIVVSAGPSLNKNIDVLKKAKGRALIVVVDTALRMLNSKNIEPDIVFTIDSDKTLELFDNYDFSKTFVFVEMVSNTRVLEKINAKNVVFYSSNSPVWAELFKKAGSEIRTVRVGGSVATEAIANMIASGFKKIILVGQDLAYTGNKQYADSKELSEDDLALAEEGRLLQNDIYRVCRKIKDVYGNDVYTPNDYYAYIKEIERMAYTYPSVEIIDATEGGARKEHTTIMTLQDALDKYCTKEYDVYEMLSRPQRLFEGEDKQIPIKQIDSMLENFEKMKNKFDECAIACEKAKYMLENKKYDVDALKKTNAMIDEVDNMYLQLLERTLIAQCVPWAEYLFYNDFYDEEKDDIKESIRLYSKSVEYYKQLSQACEALVKVTEYCKEKI